MKKLRDLTTCLQTVCHEGEADKPVMIKILDEFYFVKDVSKSVNGNKTVVVLEAESVG